MRLSLGIFGVLVGLVVARDYTYYDYAAVEAEIFRLQEEFPNLVKVTTAQDEYGLPSAGDCGDSGECKQYIVHLTNFDTYEEKKATRPEVFFSGCLHGDERVGPTALVEYMKLLTEAHASNSNAWLKMLVDTRSIYIMPMTNALGYFQNRRTENGIDPNRDFPIDLPGPVSDRCMQSITARAVNELFREHMFQVAITFHSGIRMIGYEWGDDANSGPNQWFSPDDLSQASIGAALSAFAGKFESPSPVKDSNSVPFPELYDRFTYPTGPITPLLYSVAGGMEDWAYAGNWADNKMQCNPTTYGGYPVEKTEYTDSMLRMFNILVESDDAKEPAESTLGSDEGLLSHIGGGIGHVPRHVRIILMMTEIVQPYIKFVNFEEGCSAASLEEIDPEIAEADEVNGETMVVSAEGRQPLSLSYEVGGGFTVSSTFIRIFRKPLRFDVTKDLTEEDLEDLEEVFTSKPVSGYTRWVGGGLFQSKDSSTFQDFLDPYAELEMSENDGIDDRGEYPFVPAWKICFQAPSFKGEYLVVATAKLDQNWKEVPSYSNPKGSPLQAHLSQARTNSSWLKQNGDFVVNGRLSWFSRGMILNVTKTVTGSTDNESSPGKVVAIVLLLLVVVAGVVALFFYRKHEKQKEAEREEELRNEAAKAELVDSGMSPEVRNPMFPGEA